MKALELRVFRFKKNHDYEAYYKPYLLKNYMNKNLLEIFKDIKEEDPFFSFEDSEEVYIRVNSCFYKQSSKIDALISKFGHELIIEPMDTARSIDDLIIDKSDFLEVFSLFKNYAKEDDLKAYEDLDFLYYASRQHYDQYIGDSALIFASYLINKYKEHRESVYELLSCEDRGAMYHVPLSKSVLEANRNSYELSALKMLQELFHSGFLKNNVLG